MSYFQKWAMSIALAATVALNAVTFVSQTHQAKKQNELKTQLFIIEEQLNTLESKTDSMSVELNKLRETHPYQGKWKSKKTGLCSQGNFFGFLLYTPVDTSICSNFAKVLATYKGPTAKVNSVKRHSNHSSQHFHGKAIDLAWDESVIEFLISEEGIKWIKQHNLTLYIEGKHGSKRVSKYLQHPVAKEYVFFNPAATGDHVHINI